MSKYCGKSFNYESLLEALRASHNSRKRRFASRKNAVSTEDRIIERSLFQLEENALTLNKKLLPFEREIMFNFDEALNDISTMMPEKDCMHQNDVDSSSTSGQERKHVCPLEGCDKSYTSSHGLKYHLQH